MKGDLNVSGGLKVGDSSTTCDSSTEGTVKYNYEEHRLELCNSTDWVSVSNEISRPLNCSCEGTGYKIYNVNGDIVYVDCSTDKCWTPTARLTYTWGGYGTDELTNSCVGIDSRPACNYCDNLDYGGFTDWLLPDKTTLRDLCSNQGNTPFREGTLLTTGPLLRSIATTLTLLLLTIAPCITLTLRTMLSMSGVSETEVIWLSLLLDNLVKNAQAKIKK